MKYFLDTYAMVEIVKGNTHYTKYLTQQLHTSLFHLYELFYQLLRDHDAPTAREFFTQFSDVLLPISDSHIFAAAEFKLAHAKAKLSYADALGYAMADQEGMRFLTGDQAFQHITNVEYVK